VESSSLPSEHARVLERVVEFFRGYPGAVGGSVSGSIARGVADEYSDVDVGIFFSDDESRDRAWSNRWDWEIAPWLHRFDADHVKPYFVIYIYEPGVKTVLRPNPNWWGKANHNLTEVVIQTVKSDATRLAALQAGDMEMVDPVPLQDVERLRASTRATVLAGPELRVIFLNMDSLRDELLYSSVRGKTLSRTRACARR